MMKLYTISPVTAGLITVLLILLLYYYILVKPYETTKGYKATDKATELERINKGNLCEARMMCAHRDNCAGIVKRGDSYSLVDKLDPIVPDEDYSVIRRRRIFSSPDLLSHNKQGFDVNNSDLSERISNMGKKINNYINGPKFNGPARPVSNSGVMGTAKGNSYQRVSSFVGGGCGCGPAVEGMTVMELKQLSDRDRMEANRKEGFVYDTTDPWYRYRDQGGSWYGLNELPSANASPLKM